MNTRFVTFACLAAVLAVPASASAAGRLEKAGQLAKFSAQVNGALLKEGARAVKNGDRAAFKEAARFSVKANKAMTKCAASILIKNGNC